MMASAGCAEIRGIPALAASKAYRKIGSEPKARLEQAAPHRWFRRIVRTMSVRGADHAALVSPPAIERQEIVPISLFAS